jgi:nitrogen fixation NifU-like protein
MYNKTVLDHFQNPRNLSEMKNPDAVGMGASQVCGDVMTLFLSISDGRVKDASYKTMGCGAAIASGSILTELLKGKSLKDAESVTKDTLVTALGGLPAIKMHCPELAMEALKSAFADYRRRQEPAKKN